MILRVPRLLRPLLAALLATVAVTAAALGLDEAKARGLVGERPDGYLGIVEPASAGAQVRELVESVNARRRDEYQRIAEANGVSLDVVRQLAGKKAIERTPAGQWVLLPDGRWTRK
jgi:uncharacterized protein YdbL (DUF1318 family)